MESEPLKCSRMKEAIEFLVVSGCDAPARNQDGHTSLYPAVAKGYVAVVDYLFSVMNALSDRGPPLSGSNGTWPKVCPKEDGVHGEKSSWEVRDASASEVAGVISA